MKSKEGVDLLLKMIEKADVFLDPFRPGVAEKLGIGPDVALKLNPRLIYARLTGWGQKGPYSKMAGHDINYIALTGVLAMIGRKDELPISPLNLLGDFAGGGMMCALGILLALYERTKSNKGQVIDASMVEGVFYLNSFLLQLFQQGSWSLDKGTNLLDTGAPFYDVYMTKDRKYVSVGALEPHFFAKLIKGLGIDESEFDQGDRSQWPSLRAKFAEKIGSLTQDQLSQIFDGTDACVAPVLTLNDVENHPHTSYLKLTYKDKEGNIQASPAPKLSRTSLQKNSGVNLKPGQHTLEVLSQFDISLEKIQKLIKDGTISQSPPTSKL